MLIRQLHFPSNSALGNGKCMLTDVSCRKVMKFRDAFSACWLSILPKLPSLHFQMCLQLMTTHIIPNMIHPELLLSFFSRVHQSGGPEAILALEPLHFLMREKNIEVPEFYDRLYGFIDGEIFRSPFKLIFMKQVGIFMSSTMIPAYVVAGIIKKLALVSLVSSSNVAVWSTSLIYNLLWNYPTCRPLIHRDLSSSASSESSSFDPMARKIQACNASGSSLWELKGLEAQIGSLVSKLPNIFTEKFTRPPFDMESIVAGLATVDSVTTASKELMHSWSRPPSINTDIPANLF